MPPSLRSNTCVTSPRGPLVHDYASQACICQCTIIKAGFKFLTDRYLTCLNGAGSGPGPRLPPGPEAVATTFSPADLVGFAPFIPGPG